MLKKNTIYIIVIIIVILILVGGYFLLMKNKNIDNKKVPPASDKENEKLVESGAVFSLIPPEGSYKVGDKITTSVFLESGDKISGVDAIISYDKEKLEVIGGMVSKESSIFSTWPENKVKGGEIKFSALTAPGKFFSGRGKVATIYFKAIKKGKASVRFIFNKEKPSVFDCNVASNGKDILKEVKDAVYEIK